MCGIAGVLGANDSARPLIEPLAHRGPDGIRAFQEVKHMAIGELR